MNSSRNRSTGKTGTTVDTGNTGSTRNTGSTGSAGAGRDVVDADSTERDPAWAKAARSPWTVLCAVAAVVLGPAAVTASALEQANRAPMHHAVRVDQSQAYIPTDSTRRKLAV
ncbi:hypothetical protein QF030_002737 [Streptomyces rishiriensis]|uniref:Uncharacterized protein n=1 Tax=Streptomyces rishiriensis TaxID=68264 RepID=A0ABU0NN71_STRRH|nr:hypothetical protein [Streptomyces rishiriensis]